LKLGTSELSAYKSARMPVKGSIAWLAVAVAAAVEGIALVAGADPAAQAAPANGSTSIPHHDQTVDTKTAHKSLDLKYPVFDHPNPAVRAALARAVEEQLKYYLSYAPPAGSEGGATLSCDTTAATTRVVSFVCLGDVEQAAIADLEQGMGGGARAEAQISTVLLLIDGVHVRPGALADVLADPKRMRGAILKKVQAALLQSCAGLRLQPMASLDRFTLADDGVTFYFSMDDFDMRGFDPACERKVTLTTSDLGGLLRVNGALERL
jgi:hypothetical protein